MSFSGGTFSINTTGQPVVSGTTISASVFNALTADLATGLSTCMLKDGTQTATAGIGFYAGTVSLPGIYFGTDTATGFYRIGLNNTGFAINGTKLLDLASTTVGITGTLTATTIGAFTLGGTISGGGNQINNVIIGTSTPLAGSFTTLSASGTATMAAINASGAVKVTANAATGQLWASAASGESAAMLRVSPTGASANQRDWGLVAYSTTDGDVALMVSATQGANPSSGTQVIYATRTGVVTIPNLAGVGTRTVVVDANGVLSAP